MIAASRTRVVEERQGRDPLRLLVLVGLAIYLVPALLVVMLIGGVGMVCCAVLRLIGCRPKGIEAGARHGRPAMAFGGPHLREQSRRRLTH